MSLLTKKIQDSTVNQATNRCLIFSDIHANIEALLAVLGQVYLGDSRASLHHLVPALKHSCDMYDFVLCLGDIVGYGPNPNEVIELLAKIPNFIAVIGNHDEMILKTSSNSGTEAFSDYSFHAAESLKWTFSIMDPVNLERLKQMVTVNGMWRRSLRVTGFFACHSGPGKFRGKYLVTPLYGRKPSTATAGKNPRFYDPWDALEEISEPNLFVGHTHFTAMYRENGRSVRNIGSVGLPRGDNRNAVYVVYNMSNCITELYKVGFDRELVMYKLHQTPLSFKTKRMISCYFK